MSTRSTCVLIAVAMLASACEPNSPQEAIHSSGGTDPIICYRPHRNLSACRDATARYWVCDRVYPVESMSADEPAKLFAFTPENQTGADR